MSLQTNWLFCSTNLRQFENISESSHSNDGRETIENLFVWCSLNVSTNTGEYLAIRGDKRYIYIYNFDKEIFSHVWGSEIMMISSHVARCINVKMMPRIMEDKGARDLITYYIVALNWIKIWQQTYSWVSNN